MQYLFHLLTLAGIYVVFVLSLNLSLGYLGIPVLGHAAFACLGAYTSALLALRVGVSPWLGLLAGGCIGCVAGVGLSLSCIRLKGDYLALATFGFGVIVYSLSNNWKQLTDGPLGLPGIPQLRLAGFTLSTPASFFPLVAGFAAFTFLTERRIVHSAYGRAIRCIRDDEGAARAIGKDVARYRTQTLAVSGFFAGVGGALYAHYVTFIDPTSFTVMESVNMLLMVIFGGMGSLGGSVAGALMLILLPESLRFLPMPDSVAAAARQVIYGALLVVLIIRRPQGLWGNLVEK